MKKPYPVCASIPLTFGLLYTVGPLLWLLAKEGMLSEFISSLSVTFLGVLIALLLQSWRERMKSREEKLSRARRWISIIKHGAMTNAGLVHQMLTVELPNGHIPTYPNDSVLEGSLQGAAWDLLDFPDLVGAHRGAVLELGHLWRKVDLLIGLRNAPGVQVEVTKTIAIAKNAKERLDDLLSLCSEAEQALSSASLN